MENKVFMEEDILYVHMLGGFSVTWHGTQIVNKEKSRESQMAYLLQLLLHNQDGVSRNRLEATLFGERELNDVHHALRSVIYNTKKKLKESGLPDVNYIFQKKGMFYWTKEIPVWEDAKQFELLMRQATMEKESNKKLELLLTAIDCYKGEFLSQQVDMVWVTQEARRYQSMFFACVEEAVDLLRTQGDWPRMRDLGLYASKVSPFADWEVVTMEALVLTGQMNAARKLYDDTVDLYLREQGIRPSRKLLEKMGTQVYRRYAVLDTIQEDLEEGIEKGIEKEEGGYFCSYPIFQEIYRMLSRIMERSGQSGYLMLCTLVDSKGNPMEEGNLLERLSSRMENAIRYSLRRGDVVSRYGKGQYLVLLLDTTREDCSVVQKRIDDRFLVGRQRTGIRYYVNSVIYSPFEHIEMIGGV